MTQKEALDILKMGHNAFITGAAGSGKTHLLNEYISYLKKNNAVIGITASTGIAATHMGGMTIHAWSGIGVRDTLTEYDLEDLESRKYLWNRIQEAKVLIIDEVSMIHHFRLDMVEKIVRFFKRNEEPFGGMQVILCGDFFQLPPVSRSGEPEALFAYHSEAWKNLDLKICYLEEQHRQNDKIFLDVLNSIRENMVTPEILGHLRSRFNKKPEISIEPTRLYTHNYNVDIENDRELVKVCGNSFEYKMSSRGRAPLVEALKKSCLAPEILRLKVGARVMFVKNNFEQNYVNGTLGIVTSCGDSGITVRTSKGVTVRVEPANWVIEEDGKIKAEIIQYPLRLAWAITVHKSQGMSLDAAEVDLSRSFEKGMGYVALSRVRTLAGLNLLGLNETALGVDEEVLEFDCEFREMSAKHCHELKSKKNDEIEKIQKEFLSRIVPKDGKKTKVKKASTLEETKKLISEGKSIKEVARERGVKTETIIDHLEKLKKKEPTLDLSHIKKEISGSRLKKITAALVKSGMEGGDYLLTPAKNILGSGFTFEEIRVARLFLNK